jgi:hypothetical protein
MQQCSVFLCSEHTGTRALTKVSSGTYAFGDKRVASREAKAPAMADGKHTMQVPSNIASS